MKRILFVFLLLITAGVLFSKPIIEFKEKEFDFGKIKEENGPYEHKFVFYNTGDEPLKLTKVKAGCGCTVASWSTGLINPKESGFVKVVYDSNNRPGAFHKQILVYTNAQEKPIAIQVKGFVVGTPGKFYPKNTILDLQFDKSYLNIGRIAENVRKTFTINIYNRDNEDLNIKIKEKPYYLDIILPKAVLKPKEKSEMKIVYNSAKIKKFGQLRDGISFILNGKENKKYFYVKSYRFKDFSKITEEQKKIAPKIKIVNKRTDFMHYKLNKEKYDKIKILNYGKSNLKIYNINTSDKIKVVDYPKVVEPNQTAVITIELKDKFTRDSFRGFVKIFSNDPSHFETILTISGVIGKKKKKIDTSYKKINCLKPKEITKIINSLKNEKFLKDFLYKHKAENFKIIDLRASSSYKGKHLKNSINYPLGDDEFEEAISKFDKNTIYILIGKDFEQSDTAAKMLLKRGFEHIICLKGSYYEIMDYIK